MYEKLKEKKGKLVYEGILCFCVVVFCFIFAGIQANAAKTKTSGVWRYEITGKNTVAITGYTGASKSVKIPNKIGKRKVTSLGRGFYTTAPFLNNKYIEKVFIPSSVTTIEESCFQGCKKLKQIMGCTKVVSIETRAFGGCHKLKKISFGNKLKYIGEHAFSGCESLIVNKFPDSLISIGKYAFSECNSIKTVTLPSGLSVLGSQYEVLSGYAFYNCASLKKVVLNKKIGFIAGGNFKNCTSLEEVMIPSGIESIGEGAFEGCSSLKKISIPGTVESVGQSSFCGCSGLKKVNLKYGLFTIQAWAFQGCTSLKELIIPNSVRKIENYALHDSGFVSITVPNSVKEINCDLSNATIYCYKNSYAQKWAVSNRKKYVLLTTNPCKKITLNKKKIKLKVGQKCRLKYTVKPANTSDALKWESSASDIVSVNGVGKIVAKKKGTATVIVTATSGKSARIKVTVTKVKK